MSGAAASSRYLGDGMAVEDISAIRRRRILAKGRRRLRGFLRASPPLDPGALTPFQRAVVRFDASEGGRTVARLTRVLGVPRASVGALAGTPEEVRVTVAWDLSWYQWAIAVGEGPGGVRQIAKGGEIDQLDAAARQWNAAVGEDGKLRLAGEPTASR